MKEKSHRQICRVLWKLSEEITLQAMKKQEETILTCIPSLFDSNKNVNGRYNINVYGK
jgi:hypothetical protein